MKKIKQMGLLLIVAVLAACGDKPAEPSVTPVVSSGEKAIQINGKRVALVIGNANYKNATQLPNDLNDAEDMKNTLANLGFEVMFVPDANKEQMIDSLTMFGEKLQGGAVGLLYFSGHGVEVDGEQYIVPTDAVLKTKDYVDSEAISVKKILKKMGGDNKSTLNFLILDACRNNPFSKAWGVKGTVENGFTKEIAPNPSGILIESATARGDTSSASGERNSVYTKHLLRYLNSEPTLEVGLLFRRVRAAVEEETHSDQVPWETGAIKGEFYFAQAVQPPEPPKPPEPPTAPVNVEETAKPQPATPPETIYYGSRAGMRVNVLSKQGIDSENAIIKTKHTLENAIEFCREYEHSAQKKCIDEEFSIKINDYISANCQEGNFTDFFGNVYEFQGFKDNHNDPVPLAEYAIYDYKSNEILDGTSASGYPVNLEIFKALCPSRVSKNSNEEDPIPNYSEADRDRILNPK